MKKLFAVLLTLAVLSALAACGQPAAPAPAEDGLPAAEFPALYIYGEGTALAENGFAYADLAAAFSETPLDGGTYQAASLAALLGEAAASYQAAYLVSGDGYVTYSDDLNATYLAAYEQADGVWAAIENDGQAGYNGFSADGSKNKAVTSVYLMSNPSDFAVDIRVNGESAATLTIAEFMKKTEVGDNKINVGFFDGGFKYDGGESYYEGRFLGIDYDTMLAKLAGLGVSLPAVISEVEYYGVNGLGKEGKNMEYSTEADKEKYYGNVDFFVMFDGMSVNSYAADKPVGLTAFINTSGMRWATFDMTAINIIGE